MTSLVFPFFPKKKNLSFLFNLLPAMKFTQHSIPIGVEV